MIPLIRRPRLCFSSIRIGFWFNGFWFLVCGFWFISESPIRNQKTKNQKPQTRNHKPETRNHQPETTPRRNVRNQTRPHCIIISPCENNHTRDLQRFYEQKGNRGALRLNPWSDTLLIFAVHRYSSNRSRRLD